MGDIYHIAVNCYFILHLKPSQQCQLSRLLSKMAPELFPDILCMIFPHLKIQPVIISFKQSHSQSVLCVCVCDRFLLQKSQTETKRQNKDRALEYTAVKRRPGAELNPTPRGPYQLFRRNAQSCLNLV